MSFRVCLKTPLNSSTGYGNDGIGLARALVRAGVDLSLEPTHVSAPLPWDVAELLTIEPQAPFDLRLHHLPPADLGLTRGDVDTSYRTVAWSMWEFFKFGPYADAVRPRLAGYDEVIAYDSTSQAAFQSLPGTSLTPSILQGGYEPKDWLLGREERRRDWGSKTFRFVIAGDLSARKNPYAALRVVQRLKDEGYDVELAVKARHNQTFPPGLEEKNSCLNIFTGVWSTEMMRKFYASAHCYLAPSWGEGKNLPAIEAGTTGCAIIASDVGGHQQWTHDSFATLVGGEIVGQYDDMPYLQVDEEKLYFACKELVENRQKAKLMGEAATQILPVTCSWKRVVETLLRDHAHGKVR